jgi:hypothetical protein
VSEDKLRGMGLVQAGTGFLPTLAGADLVGPNQSNCGIALRTLHQSLAVGK